jgi:hypothetical protein
VRTRHCASRAYALHRDRTRLLLRLGSDGVFVRFGKHDAILDFIDHNARGSALVISTDPVVPWVLRGAEDHCAGYFFDVRRCLQSGRRYDSIFVVFGHHNRSDDNALISQFQAIVGDITAGRTKRASMPAGHDADAALKTRLTGVTLDPAILTVDFYQ